MGISVQGNSIYAGRLPALYGKNPYGLKSTEKKLERQLECEKQVTYWTEQKKNLKNMECESLEDMRYKLELLHSYEDEIKAAKAKFNNEQMQHVLDEAREKGEKIAEAAEKQKPKTAEERRKELEKEALGTDGEEDSVLEEILEEASELAEETEDEFLNELTAKEAEELKEKEQEQIEKKQEAEIIEEDILEDRMNEA